MDTSSLMEQILSNDNLNRAYLQAVQNKGAEGVDGMKYTELGNTLQGTAKPHAKSVMKFRKRMKELTRRSWGVSNNYKVAKLNQLIRGWINYFKIGATH